MQARINVITLAVDSLQRALTFYRDGLGFYTEGVIGTEFEADEQWPAGDVVMFKLADDLTLALYPRASLVRDADRDMSGSGITLGHFVERREDVEELLARAEQAGATMHGPVGDRPWPIYSGYFSDPDGHAWEIICPRGD